MSLIHCPECGHEVSNTAVACPNCARPIVPFVEPVEPVVERQVFVPDRVVERDGFPTWAFIPIGVLGLILLIVLFVVWGRNNDDSANQRLSVNVNSQQRQTTAGIPNGPSTVTTVPSTGSSSVTIPSAPPPMPSSQTTVPGSQTSVTGPPTKGKVTIDAKLVTRNGAAQSVRNEKFYLLDQDLETILGSAGLEPIEGQTLTNSLGLSLIFPDKYGDFNRNAFRVIRPHIKYSGQTDGSGKAQLSGVEPNSYYLFGMTKAGRGFAVWNNQVSIQVGDNILNLSPQRLTEIQDSTG